MILIGLAGFIGIILFGFFVAFQGSGKKIPSTNTNQASSKSSGNSNNNGGYSGSSSFGGGGSSAQNNDINNALITTTDNQDLGKYLLTASGYPLYTYDGDSEGLNGTSCTETCTIGWEPYVVTSTRALPDNMSVFIRVDTGESQYAYKGRALYTFTGDGPGQVTGLGLANFHLAKP